MKKTRSGRVLVMVLMVLGTVLSPPIVAGQVTRRGALGLSTAGPELSDFLHIRIDDVDNLTPAVAYNSLHDEYLVVWINLRGGGTVDIYGRRVRDDGTLLGSFAIAHNDGFSNSEPAVAYSPEHDEYLIAYTYNDPMTDNDIWARRVKWDGSWMSSEFSVGRKPGSQHRPAVAYNGDADEYLAVYQNTWGGGGQDIDAERVRASDGAPLGWMNVATGANQFRSSPDVVYNPDSGKYLIAYTFRAGSSSSPGEIYGKVASSNMGDLSPEIHICVDANDQEEVSVATGSGEYLAAWHSRPNLSSTWVHARRLDGDGTPQGNSDGFPVAAAPDRHDGTPQVAYADGYAYLIIWQRSITAIGSADVYGRYVRPGHDQAVHLEFPVDDDVAEQIHPAVACGLSGDCLMTEADNSLHGIDYEILGRFVSPLHHRVYVPLVLGDAP